VYSWFGFVGVESDVGGVRSRMRSSAARDSTRVRCIPRQMWGPCAERDVGRGRSRDVEPVQDYTSLDWVKDGVEYHVQAVGVTPNAILRALNFLH
jgi:hypothetical protein